MTERLESIRERLCHGQHSIFLLSWNEFNGINYESVAQMMEDCPDQYPEQEFVGGAEGKAACGAANSIWTAQWYPETPVGFHRLSAATLPALLDALEADGRQVRIAP